MKGSTPATLDNEVIRPMVTLDQRKARRSDNEFFKIHDECLEFHEGELAKKLRKARRRKIIIESDEEVEEVLEEADAVPRPSTEKTLPAARWMTRRWKRRREKNSSPFHKRLSPESPSKIFGRFTPRCYACYIVYINVFYF